MKNLILSIALFIAVSSAYSNNLNDKVRYNGKFYTVVYEGDKYTTLQDAQGNTILVNFKNK